MVMQSGSRQNPMDHKMPGSTLTDVTDTQSFELLETLRLEQGTYALIDRHLDRLAASARYFGILIQLPVIRSALLEHRDRFPNETRRVRLLVAQDGTIRVESAALTALPEQPLLVALAKTPVARDDHFLFHKTTHRVVYEYHRRQQPDMFDVLLWNEYGELTEFTIGNLIVEQAGTCWTPRRESGLLPGTLRAELLAQEAIHERVLKLSDLARAERIWLINSVRGWVPVQLVSDVTPQPELFEMPHGR